MKPTEHLNFDASSLNLKYEGSVKNVFASKANPDKLLFSFTDKYSVFDWGQMPDLIANKGNALAIIGTYIFQKLADPIFWQKLPHAKELKKFDPQYLQNRFSHSVYSAKDGLQTTGLQSHLLGLDRGYSLPDSENEWQKLEQLFSLQKECKNYDYSKAISPDGKLLMEVLAADVNWPKHKTIMHENLYFYPPPNPNSIRRLIPLEIVFTFGRLEGSSLNRKLQEDPLYANSLGLDSVPEVNDWLGKPVLQFTSKLEPKDRLLSWQEATAIANLSAQQFEQLVELSSDIALALHVLFAEHNLELWDGKLEFIFELNEKPREQGDYPTGKLLLADCVGPDEIRLLYKGKHLSKEVLRQYYRSTAWYKSLSNARAIAAKNGQEDWQSICSEQLKQKPLPLAKEVKVLVDQLYGTITNELLGQTIFPSHPDLENFANQLEKTLSTYRKEQVNA